MYCCIRNIDIPILPSIDVIKGTRVFSRVFSMRSTSKDVVAVSLIDAPALKEFVKKMSPYVN